MSKSNFVVATIQMSSNEDVQQNWQSCKSFLSQLEEKIRLTNQRLDLVCFPENSLFLRVDPKGKIQKLELDDNIFSELLGWSQRLDALICLGSVPLIKNGKVYNSMVMSDPEKGCQSVYDKIHLFDVDVEGQAPIRESDEFCPGAEPKIYSFRDWKIGCSICYDVRFSELYLKYAKEEVDLILVPSAFLPKTGLAHWHALLRARAIESQCYVVASAQIGPHNNTQGKTRETFGHSLGVSPWGEVLFDLEKEKNKINLTELDYKKIQFVRKQIPMKTHRRLE